MYDPRNIHHVGPHLPFEALEELNYINRGGLTGIHDMGILNNQGNTNRRAGNGIGSDLENLTMHLNNITVHSKNGGTMHLDNVTINRLQNLSTFIKNMDVKDKNGKITHFRNTTISAPTHIHDATIPGRNGHPATHITDMDVDLQNLVA